MASVDTRYREYIADVAKEDVDLVLKKDKEYGASWKKRGGIGAYMMAARKMDRLEEQCMKYGYDIFKACEDQTALESIRDTMQDLRAYLLLIESEVRAAYKNKAEDLDLRRSKTISARGGGAPNDVKIAHRCNRCGSFHLDPEDCPHDPGPAHP
jgi:rubrerythrin